MTHLNQPTPTLWTNSSNVFTYHSGIFVRNSDVILIDPGLSQPEIDALAQFIRDHKWQVDTIILTHCHWDHVLGASTWPGAKLVAQRAFRDSAHNYAERVRRIIAKTPDLGRTEPFNMPEPGELFDNSMSLELDDWAFELRHTPGHAPDHLFVRETATGTVWTADMLSDEEIPYVIDNLGDYVRTMAKINAEDFRMIVPCHGSPAQDLVEIRARIENDRTYINELHGRVRDAVKAGKSMQETAALCADIPYRQSVDNNRGAHRVNVESAYAELGGDLDPKTVGWLKVAQEFAS